MNTLCKYCGETFKTFPSTLKRGSGKYCSRNCCCRDGACGRQHGWSYTRLHRIWCDMKSRCVCKRPGSLEFRYYSSRGITVCEAWRDSFVVFRDWAISSGYDDALEIDRRDRNGNYDPANCRWATRCQQMRNTRKRTNAKTSKFRGVSLHSQNHCWIVQIAQPGKSSPYVGSFDDEVEAALAYDRKARELFGEFATLNFQGGVPR